MYIGVAVLILSAHSFTAGTSTLNSLMLSRDIAPQPLKQLTQITLGLVPTEALPWKCFGLGKALSSLLTVPVVLLKVLLELFEELLELLLVSSDEFEPLLVFALAPLELSFLALELIDDVADELSPVELLTGGLALAVAVLLLAEAREVVLLTGEG